MVDHPDFCSERELEKAKATMPLQLLRDRADSDEDDEEAANAGEAQSSSNNSARANVVADTAAIDSFDPSMQRRSLCSIRAGVTVAMVAVALGFACCKFRASCLWLTFAYVTWNISLLTARCLFETGENILHIFIFNRSSLRSGKRPS